MSDPVRLDLLAERSLYLVQDLILFDDFTGVVGMLMDIRPVPDGAGSPLVALTQVTSGEGIQLPYIGTATVAAHITAGRLDNDIYSVVNPSTGAAYQPTDSVTLSQIKIVALMDTRIPYPDERGDDWIGAYDLLAAKPSDLTKKVVFGKFTVRGTVTH